MSVPASIETVVVGAGQAGLCMSWQLNRAGREHIVLEARPSLGGGWQDRWDEFRLVTPNWSSAMPGFPYDGSEPDGFMPRREIAERIAHYAEVIDAPVRLDTTVEKLSLDQDGRFCLETSSGPLSAASVVVATGSFHKPKIPALSEGLPWRLRQIHSHSYRRARDLPAGAILVVGSGQSGAQIAEELQKSGRPVYLSVGSAGRVPRRYRGRDLFYWYVEMARHGSEVGATLPTVDQLPDRRLRFAGNPAWSGHDGGKDLNLRELGSRGITLLGRIDRVEGERLTLAADLPARLQGADDFFDAWMRPFVDRYIAAAGVDAPLDDRVPFAFEPRVLESIELDREGISTLLWATGYRLDYSWIDLPIFDEFGWPRQRRGVSEVPGLYFAGLIWAHNQLSSTLVGADIETAYLAQAMGLSVPQNETLAPNEAFATGS